jgi:hypothetical protein
MAGKSAKRHAGRDELQQAATTAAPDGAVTPTCDDQ